MMIKNLTDCLPCDHGMMEHPRFFPRQMITDADLTQEQRYWRDKLRRHNRYLHGWGVVCGAQVEVVKDKAEKEIPWKVQVTPGYILGPNGDEILIDCRRVVDLQTTGVACKSGDMPGESIDVWCTPAKANRTPETDLYIAVRYCEFSTRPVRIQPNGCGCDDGQCEDSRLRDGYEIRVMTEAELPESYTNPTSKSLNELIKSKTMLDTTCIKECPDCSSDDWVILASVKPGAKGEVTDNVIHNEIRRMALSFADAWWTCTEISGPAPAAGTCKIVVDEIEARFDVIAGAVSFDPGIVTTIDAHESIRIANGGGVARIHLAIKGSGFRCGESTALPTVKSSDDTKLVVAGSPSPTIVLGPGETVLLLVTLEVITGATAGFVDLVITNSESATWTRHKLFQIE